MQEYNWNPWHGCIKYSEGCLNCYVYRGDEKYQKDSSLIVKTKDFNLPVKQRKNGEYVIPSGSIVWTCFTSDFLLKEADEWREQCFEMMRVRQDLHFLFITKRIERFKKIMPIDWEKNFQHVYIGCTTENQKRFDERLPLFLDLPISKRFIACEPLLERMDISATLCKKISLVVVGGESGINARECNYDWILSIRDQCIEKKVPFWFKQTGYNFIKDGKRYKIARKLQHSQAKKANINYEYSQSKPAFFFNS